MHVTVPHNHMADVAAVDAEKVKAAMRDRIRDVRAVFMTFVMTIKYINQKVFFYKQVYNRGGNVLP